MLSFLAVAKSICGRGGCMVADRQDIGLAGKGVQHQLPLVDIAMVARDAREVNQCQCQTRRTTRSR
jgi:hypothetical protein